MGIFVAMETYVTFFGSVHFFAHFIGYDQALCVSILRRIGWKLTILDVFINQPYHIDNIQNSENFQMTLTFDLYLTLSLTFDLDDLNKYIFFNFFHFLWSHVTQKRDVVRPNGRSHAEAPFYKEYFVANQKSVPLPVQKLWPIMWFSLNLLKSRDVKTWRRTSKRSVSDRSGIW